MKIAVLTSGILPVPAVQGGAVENLVDFYMEYNDIHRLHDITVYSISDNAIRTHPALTSDVNHYVYIDTNRFMSKIKKRILHLINKNREYYHYTIEYYLYRAMKSIAVQYYDMIIIENRPGYALRLKGKTNARIVLHLHNDMLNDETAKNKDIYNSLSRIICVSDYIAGRVNTIKQDKENAAGKSPYKTTTVHNGIDVSAFPPVTANSLGRKRLGLQAEDFVLVFSGRINKEKGISELVDAMLSLKEYKNIKLIVLGCSFYGNETAGNTFIDSLKEKAKLIKDNIIFTGFIPYRNIPSYLSLADVAVIPSTWNDPFPTTVLEAQAVGLPIITTNRGGIPEEITSDNAIILDCDIDFSKRITDAIISLYNDRTKMQNMRTASLHRSKTFTKERYAADFFKAIQQ